MLKSLQHITNTKDMLIVDALRLTLAIQNRSYVSLVKSLKHIDRNRQDNREYRPKLNQGLGVISNSWQIIDTSYRAMKLVKKVKGLKQKLPEVQSFVRTNSKSEVFRHLYQHLDNDSFSGEKIHPILGSVAWEGENPKLCYVLNVGTGSPDIHFYTLSYDTWKKEFAQKLMFSAGNQDIELDKIHASCRSFNRFFNRWLRGKGYEGQARMLPSIMTLTVP